MSTQQNGSLPTSSVQSFQQIWHTVNCIPFGNVAAYGQIADLAGLPGRARLVSKALRQAPQQNPIPWHRVLRSNGQIAFPKGSEQANRQIGLLQEEGVVVLRHKVAMQEFQWQPTLDELMFKLAF